MPVGTESDTTKISLNPLTTFNSTTPPKMSSCATTNITTDVEEKRGDDDAGDVAADRGSVNTKDGTPAADDPPAADGTTTVDSIITTTTGAGCGSVNTKDDTPAADGTTTIDSIITTTAPSTTTTTAAITSKSTKNTKAGAGIGGGIDDAKDDTTPVEENPPTVDDAIEESPTAGDTTTADGITTTARELRIEDALMYLDQVKMEFGDRPHIYIEFLDIMKTFKRRTIETPCVIRRVASLFHGNKGLLLAFNTFLAEGYRIEFPLDCSPWPIYPCYSSSSRWQWSSSSCWAFCTQLQREQL